MTRELEINYECEEPSVKRGRTAIYSNTISAFVNANKPYGIVQNPKEIKPTSLAMALNKVAEKEAHDQVKAIVRKNDVYLISKRYSQEKGITWKSKRKKKKTE